MIYWHLLKWEFRNGLALFFAVALAGSTVLFFLPDEAGVSGMFAGVFCLVAIVVLLMRRTPWCSDVAFWRTRPVAPLTFWAVRSTALTLLTVLPVMLVTAVSLSSLGILTLVLGVGIIGGFAFSSTAVIAAISAVASKGRGWGVTAIMLTALPAIVVTGLISRFYSSAPPSLWGRIIAVNLVSLAIIGAVAWLAWLIAGWRFRWKPCLVLLAAGSAVLPLLVVSLDHCFHHFGVKMGSWGEVYQLEKSGNGLLRRPLRVRGLDKGEFVVPVHISYFDENRHPVQLASRINRGSHVHFGRHLSPDQTNDVFSRVHDQFVARMDLDRLWDILRQGVPEYEQWSEADRGPRRITDGFGDYDREYFQSDQIRVGFDGYTYRFLDLDPITEIKPQLIPAAPGRLELTSADIPRPSAIDLRFEWLRAMADQNRETHSTALLSSEPPELWGILYHAPSGVAYAAASVRENRPRGSPSGLFFTRVELALRFELPALEISLLGLDARQVLEESTLYLFPVEKVGRARAELKPRETP
ncbi:MAG TPA: hypothetical protein VJ952_07090 [Opitutales bacterium]|nr:hypothetical protein [Opitutales bacterium]